MRFQNNTEIFLQSQSRQKIIIANFISSFCKIINILKHKDTFTENSEIIQISKLQV